MRSSDSEIGGTLAEGLIGSVRGIQTVGIDLLNVL